VLARGGILVDEHPFDQLVESLGLGDREQVAVSRAALDDAVSTAGAVAEPMKPVMVLGPRDWACTEPRPRRRMTWAELMRRVFALDVLECPVCQGR